MGGLAETNPTPASPSCHRPQEPAEVADLVYLLTLTAFFALCVLYVRGCERILRSSDTSDPVSDATP